MLNSATQNLISTLKSGVTEEKLNAAAQSFFQATRRATREEMNAAAKLLVQNLDFEDSFQSGFLAMVCGALIERGCDSTVFADTLIPVLNKILIACAELTRMCKSKLPDKPDEDHVPYEAFNQIRLELAATMPAESAAWRMLEETWRSAIALFSTSSTARHRALPLRDLAQQIADYHEGGHWIAMILGVLDHEPFIAIEPSTSQGIIGHLSGLVDNFQLNTLLMGLFPQTGWFTRRRVSRRAVAIAKGNGPQQGSEILTSVWNLYNWVAIQPDLTLPAPSGFDSSSTWIWNEGSPEDILTFEGHRVILLGPASYPRSWTSQRMFSHLPADVICDRKLSKTEVSDWLKKMAAAKPVN